MIRHNAGVYLLLHTGFAPDAHGICNNSCMTLRTIAATRYVTPLREGGSLPAIIEGSDDGLYVLKFRGAGQGPKALVAEVLAGELARAVGLPIPEIVLVELDADLARTEPDPEIQSLIKDSAGLNLALDYLPGSVTFDPVADQPDAALASAIVWFDAFVTNLDRTPRNANLLTWHRRLWLIDHGAAFYFHHGASDYAARSGDAFPQIKDHVLLTPATQLREADAKMTALITPSVIAEIVSMVPESWLVGEPGDGAIGDASSRRAAYIDYLCRRLSGPRQFVEEAIRARSLHL